MEAPPSQATAVVRGGELCPAPGQNAVDEEIACDISDDTAGGGDSLGARYEQSPDQMVAVTGGTIEGDLLTPN